jgi:hypothetical protein
MFLFLLDVALSYSQGFRRQIMLGERRYWELQKNRKIKRIDILPDLPRKFPPPSPNQA